MGALVTILVLVGLTAAIYFYVKKKVDAEAPVEPVEVPSEDPPVGE